MIIFTNGGAAAGAFVGTTMAIKAKKDLCLASCIPEYRNRSNELSNSETVALTFLIAMVIAGLYYVLTDRW